MARPLSEEARDKARAAAQSVIAESGIEGFTVDAVSRKSGVAKTTIYRHWDSGTALMLDAIAALVTTLPTPDTGTLAGDLEDFISAMLAMVDDPMMTRTILGVMAAAASDPELDRVHRALMAERKEPLRAILAAARRRGEVRCDIDEAMLLDMVEGPFLSRQLIRREPVQPSDTATMIELIVAAIGPR